MRAHEAWKLIPIIAVSANASDIDRAQCMAAGASAFLPKPIDRQALLDEIALQLDLSWLDAASAAKLRQAPPALLQTPPMAALKELHQFALTGNMRAIRERAAQLADQDESYRPFCDKLLQLANTYQSKAILGLVKQSLEQSRTA